jgi:hypothetical protein
MVELPTSVFVGVIAALAACIGTLFGMLVKAWGALATERKERAQLAEAARAELADMLEVQNEILERVEALASATMKPRGGAQQLQEPALAPRLRPRPQFQSNPGGRRGPEEK